MPMFTDNGTVPLVWVDVTNPTAGTYSVFHNTIAPVASTVPFLQLWSGVDGTASLTTATNQQQVYTDGVHWYVRQAPEMTSPWYLSSPHDWRPTFEVGYPPSAPAILRSRAERLREEELELIRLELEDFRQARAACNDQEAARIGRLIEARERREAERELQRIAAAERAEAARVARVQEEQRVRLEQAEAARIRTAEAAVANERAKQLLLEHLTPAQRETVERNGWFVVEGGRSKKKYRIQTGRSAGNIEELTSDLFGRDKITARICCHVNYNHAVPLHDHLLAQKIMLELAEDDFLRVANRTAT